MAEVTLVTPVPVTERIKKLQEQKSKVALPVYPTPKFSVGCQTIAWRAISKKRRTR